MFIFFEYIYLINFHRNLEMNQNFYLSLKEYHHIYEKIFFSILSLTCIGKISDYSCDPYMNIIAKTQMNNYVEESFSNYNDTLYYSDIVINDTLYNNSNKYDM